MMLTLKMSTSYIFTACDKVKLDRYYLLYAKIDVSSVLQP